MEDHRHTGTEVAGQAEAQVAATQPEAQEPRVPRLLSTEQLRTRIRPDLSKPGFVNWLHRARLTLGFPAGIRVGSRRCLWDESEVARWIASRPRGGRFDGRRRGEGAGAGKAA